jgi:hypothetical protein
VRGRWNHLGVLVEELAASEELDVPEARTPEFTAVEDTAEEFVAADEADVEDPGVVDPDEACAEVPGVDDADEGGADESVDEVSADEIDEALAADTNEAAPEDAGSEEVATADVRFTRDIENPWLVVCVLTDELYAIVDELYDWAEEIVVEIVTEVVIVI